MKRHQEGTDNPTLRVLIVEDEPILLALLAEEMREAGFLVTEASNADEAIAYYRSGLPVDLVFTDVRMPGSIDGVALARLLLREAPTLPVVVTSGNLLAHELADITRFIAKPYRLPDAIRLVFDIFGFEPRANT